MTSIFKSMQRYALLRSIAFILLGIATLLEPLQVFNLLVYIIAIYNAILGIFNLIDALRNKENRSVFQLPLAFFYLIFALIIYLFASSILSIITIFIGILLMIGGATKISQSFNLKQYVNLPWVPMLIYGLLLVVAGGLIMFNPFATKLLLYQFFGIILLITGVSELIAYFKFRNVEI